MLDERTLSETEKADAREELMKLREQLREKSHDGGDKHDDDMRHDDMMHDDEKMHDHDMMHDDKMHHDKKHDVEKMHHDKKHHDKDHDMHEKHHGGRKSSKGGKKKDDWLCEQAWKIHDEINEYRDADERGKEKKAKSWVDDIGDELNEIFDDATHLSFAATATAIAVAAILV